MEFLKVLNKHTFVRNIKNLAYFDHLSKYCWKNEPTVGIRNKFNTIAAELHVDSGIKEIGMGNHKATVPLMQVFMAQVFPHNHIRY